MSYKAPRQPIIAQADIDWLVALPKPIEADNWRTQLLPLTDTPMSRVQTLEIGELPEGQPLGGSLSIYCREGKANAPGDWSCGLVYTDYADRSYPVVRCNGGHLTVHKNRIEGDKFIGVPHVHYLTERYQALGILNSGYAEVTSEFSTLGEALDYLARVVNFEPAGRLFL